LLIVLIFTDICYTDFGVLCLSFSTQILSSSEYFHYKKFIHEKCLENENDKFQKSLSWPSKIDARAHLWAAARRLRSIALELLRYSGHGDEYVDGARRDLEHSRKPMALFQGNLFLETVGSGIPWTYGPHAPRF
jgi:hypothetical protein